MASYWDFHSYWNLSLHTCYLTCLSSPPVSILTHTKVPHQKIRQVVMIKITIIYKIIFSWTSHQRLRAVGWRHCDITAGGGISVNLPDRLIFRATFHCWEQGHAGLRSLTTLCLRTTTTGWISARWLPLQAFGMFAHTNNHSITTTNNFLTIVNILLHILQNDWFIFSRFFSLYIICRFEIT